MLALILAATLAAAPAAPAAATELVESITHPGHLADLIAANVDVPIEEKQQVLEALKTINETFKGAQPAPAPQAEKKDSGKSMADVADKALDISTKYIGQAAAILEKAAPHVWRVMVMQQYAKAVGEIAIPFGWMLMILVATAVLRSQWKIYPKNVYEKDAEGKRTSEILHHASSDDETTAHTLAALVVPILAELIAGGFFVYNLANSAMYLINPEYYAIKDLVAMLLHGQM